MSILLADDYFLVAFEKGATDITYVRESDWN